MPISLWAVLAGGLINLVAGKVLGLAALFLWLSMAQGVAPSDAAHPRQAELLLSLRGQPGLAALQWAMGALGSVLGGFAAATLARREEVLNGTLAAWAILFLGVMPVLRGTGAIEHPVQLLAQLAVSLGFCALGGWLRAQQLERRVI